VKYPQWTYTVRVTQQAGGYSSPEVVTSPEQAVADMGSAAGLSGAFRVALMETERVSAYDSKPAVAVTDVAGAAHPEFAAERLVSLRAELTIVDHFAMRFPPEPTEENEEG